MLHGFTKPRARPGSLAASEGFAVPTVLMATLAAFALASAVVVSSIGAQSGTVRDQNSKAALGAAEAGVANALLRFNRVRPSTPANVCEPVGATTPGAGGWCPTEISGSIDRGSFSYRVRVTPAQGSIPGQLGVISTGTVDGVTRRVSTMADSNAAGYKPFEGLASVIGLDSIYLNSKATVSADVATNGSIGLNNNSVLNCEYAQVGIGHGYSPNNGGAVSCPPTQGTVSLPPVNPGDVMTNNSNDRICNLDPINGQSCASAWNPTTKRLTLNNGGSITLGSAGGEFNYAFCQIVLDANSYLHIAGGAKVRLYFGSPDGAPCTNQGSPLILNSGSKIQPTGAGAADLAILIVGSDTKPTNVVLNADAILFNCDQAFVLYAPRTSVTLNSRSNVCGGIAAKSVVVNSDASITASNSADDFELPGVDGVVHYGLPRDFVECTAAPPAPPQPPDSGC
jgi:hypothetical protein